MSTIEDKLSEFKTNTNDWLIQFYVDKSIAKAMNIIASHYSIPRAEYVRRCISLCIAQIRDEKLLNKLAKNEVDL